MLSVAGTTARSGSNWQPCPVPPVVFPAFLRHCILKAPNSCNTPTQSTVYKYSRARFFDVRASSPCRSFAPATRTSSRGCTSSGGCSRTQCTLPSSTQVRPTAEVIKALVLCLPWLSHVLMLSIAIACTCNVSFMRVSNGVKVLGMFLLPGKEVWAARRYQLVGTTHASCDSGSAPHGFLLLHTLQ